MTYIDELKDERIRRGISQKDIAEAMGTTQSAVSRAEREGNPRQDFLRRYQNALRQVGATDSVLELATIRMVVSKVARRYGIGEMYLYGSMARGDADADSDIDLMYRYRKDTPGHLPDIARMKTDLERMLGREVSLLSLDSLEKHALTSRASRRFYECAKADMVKVA
ncbi:nucleotidyltransferase [Bifidobacterium lemurum]|uniref:Nucleotidyltransferase n=1 Tax=Bifidobacterium lemurum TaxID=1603886 RepID=A0A261FWB4_9BIFI|nr:nucleotidyltransferase domain-containing protein [Bifidobacterium lemurum]OZG63442.1 nucleotidyltransferase [Bifidobacterium lemurum]QOL34344.1 helix-turn-helix domain-containing protein [Bifidobacterium lemurum]